MKIAVIFAYFLLCTVYLTPIADSGRIWGGINLITQSAFIGYLCYLAQRKERELERLFFRYIMWLSAANCGYILACMIRGESWAIYNTDLFVYISGLGFAVFLIHCALKER